MIFRLGSEATIPVLLREDESGEEGGSREQRPSLEP